MYVTAVALTSLLVMDCRAGMDEATCAMVQDYDNIVYISCNPDTLRKNLDAICKTHQVVRVSLHATDVLVYPVICVICVCVVTMFLLLLAA